MASIAHGGRLSEARQLFPDAPEPWLDLSTGINPRPYSFAPIPVEYFTRLPDPEDVNILQSIAAAAYGVPDETMVAAAPGTQILINLMPRLWPAGRVAVLGPTYGEYSRVWSRAGAPVEQVVEVAALPDGAAVVVVCNPNNPDGRRRSSGELLALADRMAARGSILVVDEAFADLEDDDVSLAKALPHWGIVILRSFGKTYGLAGVRLGFALAAPHRAAQIREALGPWAVSGPALAIGQTALSDRGWLARTRERCSRDAHELDQLLSGAGLRMLGGTRLFRLAESPNAWPFFCKLGKAGIFVRRFSDQPTWLRFGLPGSAVQMDRLAAALHG
ncbi:MAG: threonine-phosphate decarboxylase [Acetobacteraceae bacterium]|nr:threonine-phosphate decarboxylase [Acetobacteraceae bacterium]